MEVRLTGLAEALEMSLQGIQHHAKEVGLSESRQEETLENDSSAKGGKEKPAESPQDVEASEDANKNSGSTQTGEKPAGGRITPLRSRRNLAKSGMESHTRSLWEAKGQRDVEDQVKPLDIWCTRAACVVGGADVSCTHRGAQLRKLISMVPENRTDCEVSFGTNCEKHW
ncbi:hypothetical protein NDU88_003566 [Pleurodeles waltl]|uniref:Uncharacterized protein n=1 Tax=Pleurodeles waltl TaxID=8319 RepID=A0AAV7VHG7_PLEWA|nr:hypothetical protein NDU88_003566 [Pleurodeles waltl]